MAVIVSIVIPDADQDDHDRMSAAVEERLERLGGPPEGLMVHLGHPNGSDLTIVEAWRTEELFRAFADEVLTPAMTDAGLRPGTPVVTPAWSIARP